MDKWEDLTISNDFLFSKLMRDKEICREVLEVLLDFKIGDITYLEEEKSINIVYDAKSVRLDVYAETEQKIYNIEMQVVNNYNLPKRSRYYQAMIDLSAIEKGETYNKLKDSYVIFICTFDPFDKNFPKYTFSNVCMEEKSLKLNDGVNKIFFNAKAFENEKNENLKAFLKYIAGEKTNNKFINKIDEKVEKIKENKEWRVEYMTLEMKLNETFEEGREEGIIKGREEGIREGMIKGTVNTLKGIGLSKDEIIEKASKQLNINKEEIEKYL